MQREIFGLELGSKFQGIMCKGVRIWKRVSMCELIWDIVDVLQKLLSWYNNIRRVN